MIPGRRSLALSRVLCARPLLQPPAVCISASWSDLGADPPSEERPAPGELVLPPRCTHRLMEANSGCGGHLNGNPPHPPSAGGPLKPYLAAAVQHGALRYHQSTVASRSWRSARKPQVSHNMWQRGIPDSTGYRMHITIRVPTTPGVFLVPIRSAPQIRSIKGPDSGFRQEASSWTGAATRWRVEGALANFDGVTGKN